MNDSTGQPDYTAYNAVHWDGNKWELKRITVNFRGNQITLPLEGAITFSTSDIWLVGSLPIHGDGKNWTLFDLRTTLDPDISLSKGWGVNSNEIYFVGRGGSSVRFENNNWDKINNGTTIELTDIYGNNDGKSIWACGYAMDYSQSSILKFDGTTWKTIWSTNAVNTPPYGYLVSTIWAGDKYLYVGAGDGIYRTPLNGSDTTQKVLPLQLGPHRIRGSAENNIAVAVDDGSIWHYNGATWFQETPTVLFRPFIFNSSN